MTQPLISFSLVSRTKPPGDRVRLHGELAALGRSLRATTSCMILNRFSSNNGLRAEVTFTVVHWDTHNSKTFLKFKSVATLKKQTRSRICGGTGSHTAQRRMRSETTYNENRLPQRTHQEAAATHVSAQRQRTHLERGRKSSRHLKIGASNDSVPIGGGMHCKLLIGGGMATGCTRACMVPWISSLGTGMSESDRAARELIAEIQSIFKPTLGAVRDHTCASEWIECS